MYIKDIAIDDSSALYIHDKTKPLHVSHDENSSLLADVRFLIDLVINLIYSSKQGLFSLHPRVIIIFPF